MSEELKSSRVPWDIRRKGRAWEGDEIRERYNRAPDKIELIEGKVFWVDEQRRMMLGLMLENLGIDEALRFGDPAVWREAIEALGRTT